MKRKGLKLDVSSSGALAASLDKCIVRLFTSHLTPRRIVPLVHRAVHLSCEDLLEKIDNA